MGAGLADTITDKQLDLLRSLASDFGWDEAEADQRAGGPLGELGKEAASDLITAWKQRAREVPRPRKVADIRNLSHSQLNVLNDCGRKYELYYVERVPRRSFGSFLGGIAVHETIEHAYRSRLFTEAPIAADLLDVDDRPWWGFYLRTFRKSVEDQGGPEKVRWGGRSSARWPDGETYEFWQSDEVRQMLRRAAALARHDAETGTVVFGEASGRMDGVEMRVIVPLHPEDPDGRVLEVRIDAFVLVDNGEPVVRDWTTGKVGGKNPMQAATYAWALERGGVISGVRRAQYVYLRAGSWDEGIVEIDLTDLVPLVEPMYATMERQVEAELFPINPEAWCPGCAVKDWCEYGRTVPDKEG